MFNLFRNPIRELVKVAVEKIYTDTENKYNERLKLIDSLENLRDEVEKLLIEKSRREEEYNRREREITHKLGLERIRQEQDNENYKKEIELNIREGNLSASEKQFKSQMEFQRKQLEEQIKGLQALVEKVFEKIPDVKHETRIVKRITEGSE